MKKALLLAGAAICFFLSMQAQDYTTPGTGTVYSFEALSSIPGSGVTLTDGIYVVNGKVTIAENDAFVIDSGAEIRFGDEAELVVNGKADLRAESPTLLGGLSGTTSCYGMNMQSGEVTEVSNLTFEEVGLRGGSSAGMHVNNCKFLHHNGTTSAALFLGGDGASFEIIGCEFENCQKAAIGGAANYLCPVTIQDCVFRKNSQANGNIPQLNLTGAETITIKNCVVEGDSTLNMVGGIAVANWFGTAGINVCIEDCEISDNRYGITTMGVMDVVIKNNQIVNNKFESNPNNGGSGISLYDPYYKQNAVITGNRIERSLWGITVIGCSEVNLGKTTVDTDASDYNPGGNVFIDNGNNGTLYDIYNNSSNTVYAQGNFWNVASQDSVSIETVVYHKNDNPTLGEVIYMPAGDVQGVRDVPGVGNGRDKMYNLLGMPVDEKMAAPQQKQIIISNGRKEVR